MKKLLGLLLVVMMGFTACEGPMGPEGLPGRDGESTQWFVKDYDVLSNQWTLTFDQNLGPFFEYTVNIPQLSDFVFDEGAVVCYLVQNVNYGGKTSLVQIALPYTLYAEYEEDGFPYSENYSYEVTPGKIRFIAKYSDFVTDIQPMDCTFHVVLMW